MRATRSLPVGHVIVGLHGCVTPVRGRLTLEIGADHHLDPDGHVWGFANHSCDPNAGVDLGARALRALHPIPAGDEITWNYMTTEWELAHPFQCRCRTRACLGVIRGLRFVPPERITVFADQISLALRTRVDEMAGFATR